MNLLVTDRRHFEDKDVFYEAIFRQTADVFRLLAWQLKSEFGVGIGIGIEHKWLRIRFRQRNGKVL